jgi:DNA-binding transcriptional regulator YiaG
MSIANRLQRARAKLDLTQQQAATLWGLNVRTLQGWERSQHEPTGFARAQLERLLSEILESKDPRSRKGGL